MEIICTINGFTVKAMPNGEWQATCEHQNDVLRFSDLSSAYVYLHNYQMCWEQDMHPNHEFALNGMLTRTR